MIEFVNVSKSWDGGRSFAVSEFSLTVEAGQIVALLGGSGCGKSTTVKMVNRLVEPTSGCVQLKGQPVDSMDPVRLRRDVGYVFQRIGLFPHLTVAENVSIVPRLRGASADVCRKRSEELMELVHLPPAEFAERYPGQLSGGQQQRIGFARALAASPDVILLDEPFGALDPVTRANLQEEFAALQRRLAFTALLVTHDMAEALLLADRIAVMQHGRILRIGSPGELLQDPQHEYVAALLETPRRHSQIIQQLQAGMSPTRDDRANE